MWLLIRDYSRSQFVRAHGGNKALIIIPIIPHAEWYLLPRKTWSPVGGGKITDFGIHPLTGRRRREDGGVQR